MKRILVVLAVLVGSLLPVTASQAATSPDTHPGAHISFQGDAGEFCTFPVTLSFTDNSRVRELPSGDIFGHGYVSGTFKNDLTGATLTRIASGPGTISDDLVTFSGTWVWEIPASDPGGPIIWFTQGNGTFTPSTGQFAFGNGARVFDVCAALG